MSRLTERPLPGTQPDPKYPDSDGRFMGDTDFHAVAQIELRQGLEDFFTLEPDVYVASNIIYYYEQADPRARRDPDILVARGVGKHKRRSYRIWEEKKIPRVFFEISSRRSWRVDIGEKRLLYARLRIPEYFVFDPEGLYLDPPLLGFRSVKGVSVPMEPNTDGSLTSRELGLRLVVEGSSLRLVDVRTGERILTRGEQTQLAREREQQEKQRADQLDAELKRLRALLAQRKKNKK